MTAGPASSLGTERFLEIFFGSGTQIRVSGTTGSERVMRWVERLRREPPLPSLLPLEKPDGTFLLVAIAFTEQEAAELAAVLMGFIGPTWSAFAGYRAERRLLHRCRDHAHQRAR